MLDDNRASNFRLGCRGPGTIGRGHWSSALNNLSKSKLLALRQCPKRLWLEVHKPELSNNLATTEAAFQVGHRVGDVARRLYDPKQSGIQVDAKSEGIAAALKRSLVLLGSEQPIFEAGFSAEGGLVFADIMLPKKKPGQFEWRIIEVKASTSVKNYHLEDAAIQAYVSKAAGAPVTSIAVAHIDSSWTYRGNGDYSGLFKEEDVTQRANDLSQHVRSWLLEARATIERESEPKISTGSHCSSPFECGFADYCSSKEPQATHSFALLPNISKKIRAHAQEHQVIELKDIPDELLNDTQMRVKKHTLSNTVYFDRKGAAAALGRFRLPAYFLDFETISLAVPIWKGTRPYQQIPFQFSLHRLGSDGSLDHAEFLQIDGADPSKSLAESLTEKCQGKGAIFAYNASFEKSRILELARRFPSRKEALQSIAGRIVDLMPIARAHYYHPTQNGSWSLKAVLPAAVPGLSYTSLDGVKDGGMAMTAFIEAIHPNTLPSRKSDLDGQLRKYCKLDTYALVRLWQVLADRKDLRIRG